MVPSNLWVTFQCILIFHLCLLISTSFTHLHQFIRIWFMQITIFHPCRFGSYLFPFISSIYLLQIILIWGIFTSFLVCYFSPATKKSFPLHSIYRLHSMDALDLPFDNVFTFHHISCIFNNSNIMLSTIYDPIRFDSFIIFPFSSSILSSVTSFHHCT